MAIHRYPMYKLSVIVDGKPMQLIANENQINSASKVLVGNVINLKSKVLYLSLESHKSGAIQRDENTFTNLFRFLSKIQRTTGVKLKLK